MSTNETWIKSSPRKKPEGIMLAGIYEITSPNNETRTVVCTGIEWNSDGITKITFYEPARDRLNDCTAEEVSQMIGKGMFQIKSVKYGRKLVSY